MGINVNNLKEDPIVLEEYRNKSTNSYESASFEGINTYIKDKRKGNSYKLSFEHTIDFKDSFKEPVGEKFTNSREEMRDMDNEFKDLKRDVLDSEKRIQDTEKRIYESNRDMELRLNKNLDEIKSLFQEYRQDLKESNKKNEDNLLRIETKVENFETRIEDKIGKLENKIDSSNKWIVGLCISSIIGIAAMVITVVLT